MTQKTQRELRYFVAKFGETYEDEYPVEGGCYPLKRRYWPDNFLASTPNHPISVGDVALLYCFENYFGDIAKIPGIGVVYSIDEGDEKNTLRYHYVPLSSPIDSNTIRTKLTASGMLGDLQNILDSLRSQYCYLRMISNKSAQVLLVGCQINWP